MSIYQGISALRVRRPSRIRRRSIAIAIVALTAATFATATSLPAGAVTRSSEWPQYGYGPAGVWFNPNETVLGAGNIASITKKYDFTQPLDNPIRAEVMGGGLRYFALASGLQAVDAATGQPQWFTAKAKGAGTLAYDQGLVITLGKTLQAFDAATGALRWQAASVHVGTYCCGSALAVRNGLVYVLREDNIYPTDQLTAYMTGVRESTGAVRWTKSWHVFSQADTGFAVTATALVTPAERSGSNGPARLAVRDPMTGRVLWAKSLPTHAGIGELAIQSNVAYVTENGTGGIVSVDLNTRGVRTVMAPWGGDVTMAFAYGTMFVNERPNGGDGSFVVAAIDPATGNAHWTQTYPGYGGGTLWGHILVANGVVYAAYNELDLRSPSYVMAWSADTGQQLLALPLTPLMGENSARLEIAGGRVNIFWGRYIDFPAGLASFGL